MREVTNREVKEMAALMNEGYHVVEIAEWTGRHRTTVWRHTKGLLRQKRNRRLLDPKRCWELNQQGWNYRQIGGRYGTTKQAVYWAVKKHQRQLRDEVRA